MSDIELSIDTTTDIELSVASDVTAISIATVGAQGPSGDAEVGSGTVIDGGTFN